MDDMALGCEWCGVQPEHDTWYIWLTVSMEGREHKRVAHACCEDHANKTFDSLVHDVKITRSDPVQPYAECERCGQRVKVSELNILSADGWDQNACQSCRDAYDRQEARLHN